MELLNNKDFLKLNKYISATEYLKKEAFCFTKITKNNEKTNENSREAETVFNSEDKIKKKALPKEKRDVRALLLPATHLLHL